MKIKIDLRSTSATTLEVYVADHIDKDDVQIAFTEAPTSAVMTIEGPGITPRIEGCFKSRHLPREKR